MPSYYEIPVIIPSYEPDEKLITLLTALQEAGIRHVIVVDDGSGTRYASFFERAAAFENCEVLRHAVNLGKGRALKTAFNHCLLASGGITGGAGSVCCGIPGCVTADSDGQHTPADILACMRRLWDNPESLSGTLVAKRGPCRHRRPVEIATAQDQALRIVPQPAHAGQYVCRRCLQGPLLATSVPDRCSVICWAFQCRTPRRGCVPFRLFSWKSCWRLKGSASSTRPIC